MEYKEVLNRIGLDDLEVICAYLYGSRVYGTYSDKSDYDFIFVVKNKTRDQFSDRLINVNFFDLEGHNTRIRNHEISALETLWLEPEYVLKETYKPEFVLNLKSLRHGISKKSSNSWVKCKKKLTVEKDLDISIGTKSLFHSLRIIDFGTQIANHGKIIDYASSNHIWSDVKYRYDWSDIYENYKPEFNRYMTEFRKVAPK